jgi:multicomponent Na+:H+ antiporter subunit D
MIAGPVLLIALPLLMSPLIWLLRRWAVVAAFLSAGVCVSMALLAWRLPLDQPAQLFGRQLALGETVSVLGRDLVMSQADRLNLVMIYLVAAGLFFFAWRVSQGWTFYPLGLALLSVLSGALLVESHIFAALLVQIAAALCVFLIQGGQSGSTRGALRFLTFVTLAIPPLLATSWLLGQYELTPDNTHLLDSSTLLFAFGFAILLGIVPFHVWVPAVSADAPPLVSTFVLGLFYAVIWFFMLDLMQSFDWLASHPGFRMAFNFGGYAMVVVGAGMAAVQKRLGPLMGYAALADMGAAQLALALQTPVGLDAALLALGTRAISLTVMAMGISVIRHRAEGDSFERLAGWGRYVPWATVAMVVGGLSLAGLPPTPGFAVRWSITRLVARQDPVGAVVLLLASVVVSIGVVRALLSLLSEPEQDYVGSEVVGEIEAAAHADKPPEKPKREREPRLAATIIIAALLFSLLLGVWPQLHTSVIQQAAANYHFFDTTAR